MINGPADNIPALCFYMLIESLLHLGTDFDCLLILARFYPV